MRLRRRSAAAALLIVGSFVGFLLPRAAAQTASIHVVNSTGDGGNVGSSNFCDDGTGACTLRAAIEAANGQSGTNRIQFQLPAGSVINLTRALPDIIEAVNIIGPGAANLTVRRESTSNFRIFTITAAGTTQISGLTIRDGSSTSGSGGFGGGIHIATAGTVNITSCVIRNNQAATRGGGIDHSFTGTVNVTGCTITENGASQASTGFGGAGIFNNRGTLTVTDSTVTKNVTGDARGGGGIRHLNGEGSLSIVNSIISENTGGGITARAPLTVSGSTIAANSGGGIYSEGAPTVNVTNTTISGNRASSSGGGIYIPIGGVVNIVNSTVSGNSASFGGGIASDGDATINLTNSTVAGNSASSIGGGLLNNNNRPFNVKSSIVALNTAAGSAPDVAGSFTSHGFNLIGVEQNNGFTAATDQKGGLGAPLDPKLGPLQQNGGPTETMALQPDSPALDQASSAALTGTLTTDQRQAFPRTQDQPEVANAAGGDGTDIGAFEIAEALPTPSPSPTASSTPTATASPTPAPTPTITPTPTPEPNRFANISTRLRVEAGDNVLIGGFIVAGSMQKRILIRAIGPSLEVDGKLSNPVLELYRGDELIATNDNWEDAPNKQEIIDSTIAPSDAFESAILRNLDLGAYTAVVRDAADGAGVGLVEVYDLGSAQDSKLANIATRGRVQSGDNVMIGGLIITGSSPQRVILRAIGPSLGIAGQLEDPRLELFDANGTSVTSNDNWRSDQEAEIEATTIPPSNDLESAIVTSLPPAAYTAIVRGGADTTGVALVEAYALD